MSVQEQHNRESLSNCTPSCSTYLRNGNTSKPRKVIFVREMWGCVNCFIVLSVTVGPRHDDLSVIGKDNMTTLAPSGPMGKS